MTSAVERYLKWWRKATGRMTTEWVIEKGSKVFVANGVFNPARYLTYSTGIIVDHFPRVEGKFVLDIGTGTGVLALHAEKLGARKVVAIDNDDRAAKCAVSNVASAGLTDTVEVRYCSYVEATDRNVDVVLCNLPIKREELSADHFQTLFFWLNARLDSEGKALITTAEFGVPTEHIINQAKKAGLVGDIVATSDAFDVAWSLIEVKRSN